MRMKTRQGKAEDDVLLAKWLQRSQKEYISPQIQNEILSTMSNNIVIGIADTIRDLPVIQYAVIMDGTQDISGQEQESICLRYVDNDLKPHEEFIGIDSLDWVNQLGVLLSHSGKFKAIHAAMAHAENPSCTAIKPLCPTRWTVRGKAITAVLSQYGSVLASLQEMAFGASNTASTANGLLGQFRKGKKKKFWVSSLPHQ
ncbi:hypothetical protein N1851_017198 [Merluccius polli]|uniref:DUF4371 domain-containing protein n=1 Tax=Merluccius polli TaxID=89951 RepID=A0AA47MQQ9_MERPO|nr:hypothetical protein N1851_017198 [Merluccius polli]